MRTQKTVGVKPAAERGERRRIWRAGRRALIYIAFPSPLAPSRVSGWPLWPIGGGGGEGGVWRRDRSAVVSQSAVVPALQHPHSQDAEARRERCHPSATFPPSSRRGRGRVARRQTITNRSCADERTRGEGKSLKKKNRAQLRLPLLAEASDNVFAVFKVFSCRRLPPPHGCPAITCCVTCNHDTIALTHPLLGESSPPPPLPHPTLWQGGSQHPIKKKKR
jgi:hypothetical protein